MNSWVKSQGGRIRPGARGISLGTGFPAASFTVREVVPPPVLHQPTGLEPCSPPADGSLGEGLLRLSPSPAPRRLLPGVTRAGLRHAQPPQQRGVGGPVQTETESTHLAFNSIQFQHARLSAALSVDLAPPMAGEQQQSCHGGEQLCEAFAFWLLTCRAACRGSFQDSRPGHR